MDGTDDSQSYFSAASPPKVGGLDETLEELKLMQRNLVASRQGSPSRGAFIGQQNPNVIIPSTGAANYWYVDPKAQSFNPMTYSPVMSSGQRGLNAGQDMEIQSARISQLYGRRPSTIQSGPQERPSGYAEMAKEPGIVAVPTMDLEGGAEGTGIHEIDGKFYILPTQVNGVKFGPGDAAVERFRQTGEHLGVFNAEDDASIFEQKHLQDLGAKEGQKQFQLLPKGTPNILMNTKGLPRFAGERDDLLKETEDTFYGGGQAPRPTPKPTPKPSKFFPVSYFT
jgi:hypothetical protein